MHLKHQRKNKQIWINDINNKKYAKLKNNFYGALQQQSKDTRINYYDFLLVAKQLAFRFQQSSHLMALKNFFSKNKNSILIKKLVDSLCISEQSLFTDEKIIVKFAVPEINFAPIKQETLQDEQHSGQQDENYYDNEREDFQKLGNQLTDDHQRQLSQKMAIILSIKVQEMQKKIVALVTVNLHGQTLPSYFDRKIDTQISYDQLKKAILQILAHTKEKLKISQDDIKTIFHILNGESQSGYLQLQDLQKLKDLPTIVQKMKQFYKSRINRDMVKNTLFKLGRVKNNSIQIYQLKNASLLQFKQIQDSIVNSADKLRQNNIRILKQQKSKSRIPHFGPLKGAAKWQKQQQLNANGHQSQAHYTSVASSTHPFPANNRMTAGSINKQRQKIEKILRQSKDQKVRQRSNQTVASKLRSLFIHKVILPREKMLEQQKERFMKAKLPQHQLSIRPLK